MPNDAFLLHDGNEYGPFSPSQLRQLADAGKIGPDDLIKKGRNGQPVPARTVAGLVDAFGSATSQSPALSHKPAHSTDAAWLNEVLSDENQAEQPARLPPRVDPRVRRLIDASGGSSDPSWLTTERVPPGFDPYHIWLGIPKGKRPPTHYQLLRIASSEHADEVIEAAAERQTEYVRKCRIGEYAALADRLLYEIEEAKLCLLNPRLKKDYDEKLAEGKPTSPEKRILPPPSKPVGEQNEIVRTYFGIVSIILAAFIIMAVVTFVLPWQRVVFNSTEQARQPNQQNIQVGNAQAPKVAQVQQPKIAAKVGGMAAAPKGAAPGQQDNVPGEPVEPATLEAKITAVDGPGRSITVSHKSKTVALDVSRVAKITVDGAGAAIDSLHPGQIAIIEFDPQHDVAVKIDVTSAAEKTVISKQETNPAADDAGKEQKGDLATVDVTIQKVDVEGRQITAIRKSKTAAFDVSRKADVIVGGKAAGLESLRPDQKATITFDPDNEIVVRVEAQATTQESPTAPTTPKVVASSPLSQHKCELVELSDLNSGNYTGDPWVSQDGLTIYWVAGDGWIWNASRKDDKSPFRTKQRIVKGMMPTVSSDGLELIFVGTPIDGQRGNSLYVTRRQSSDSFFERPTQIKEASQVDYPRNPCLSPDGLALYLSFSLDGSIIDRKDSTQTERFKTWSFGLLTRADRDSAWSSVKPLMLMKDRIEGKLTWLFPSSDGLAMLCAREGWNDDQGMLMFWTRESANEPFARSTFIQINELPTLIGRSPRYCARTQELVFARYVGNGKNRKIALWMVKHLNLPGFAGAK
jgi:hypothetical protein